MNRDRVLPGYCFHRVALQSHLLPAFHPFLPVVVDTAILKKNNDAQMGDSILVRVWEKTEQDHTRPCRLGPSRVRVSLSYGDELCDIRA